MSVNYARPEAPFIVSLRRDASNSTACPSVHSLYIRRTHSASLHHVRCTGPFGRERCADLSHAQRALRRDLARAKGGVGMAAYIQEIYNAAPRRGPCRGASALALPCGTREPRSACHHRARCTGAACQSRPLYSPDECNALWRRSVRPSPCPLPSFQAALCSTLAPRRAHALALGAAWHSACRSSG